jgi:hypothetical protein
VDDDLALKLSWQSSQAFQKLSCEENGILAELWPTLQLQAISEVTGRPNQRPLSCRFEAHKSRLSGPLLVYKRHLDKPRTRSKPTPIIPDSIKKWPHINKQHHGFNLTSFSPVKSGQSPAKTYIQPESKIFAREVFSQQLAQELPIKILRKLGTAFSSMPPEEVAVNKLCSFKVINGDVL